MKEAKRFVCWICSRNYKEPATAQKCEARGLMVPYYSIGDTVEYTVNLGSDRDGPNFAKKTGVIVDILFPIPRNYVSGRAFLHTYQVSYLVRTEKPESESEVQFFDQENIELLQATKTVKVVNEGDVLFENGNRLNDAINPEIHRSRRTIVASWADYVADVVSLNPQLKDRLEGFTKKLLELGCLDK